MAPAPNDPMQIISRFGQAWADHDLDMAMTFVAPDAVFDATGPAPNGIQYQGHAAIRAAWQSIFDDVDSTFTIEETFVVAEDRVVQLWRYEWEGGHVRGVDLFALEGSQITEKRSYVKG